jgi:hypothetical protein
VLLIKRQGISIWKSTIKYYIYYFEYHIWYKIVFSTFTYVLCISQYVFRTFYLVLPSKEKKVRTFLCTYIYPRNIRWGLMVFSPMILFLRYLPNDGSFFRTIRFWIRGQKNHLCFFIWRNKSILTQGLFCMIYKSP